MTSLELARTTLPDLRMPTLPTEEEIVYCEAQLEVAYNKMHQPAHAVAATVRPGARR